MHSPGRKVLYSYSNFTVAKHAEHLTDNKSASRVQSVVMALCRSDRVRE